MLKVELYVWSVQLFFVTLQQKQKNNMAYDYKM